MKIISSASLSRLSVLGTRAWEGYENVKMFVIVCKSGLARCGDNLYKSIANFHLFAWNSFFIYTFYN